MPCVSCLSKCKLSTQLSCWTGNADQHLSASWESSTLQQISSHNQGGSFLFDAPTYLSLVLMRACSCIRRGWSSKIHWQLTMMRLNKWASLHILRNNCPSFGCSLSCFYNPFLSLGCKQGFVSDWTVYDNYYHVPMSLLQFFKVMLISKASFVGSASFIRHSDMEHPFTLLCWFSLFFLSYSFSRKFPFPCKRKQENDAIRWILLL